MKMNEVKSVTWTKLAEIPTDDFTDKEIARAINEEFGEMLFEDVRQEIADGNIQIAEDEIIDWGSWKEVKVNDRVKSKILRGRKRRSTY